MQRRSFLRLMLACGTSALAGKAGAQSAAPAGYPERPIRMIVPFPPGGGTDTAARIVGALLGARIGKPFVIENRGGANSIIGTAAVARSAGDGYTLLFGSTTLVINPALYPSVPYDALKDFIPISLAASTPPILVTHPSVEARNLQELIALIKANPGMFYASTGTGTAQHLAGELFKLQQGLDLVHVPFNGGGPAVTAILGNQIPMLFNSLPAVLPLIKSGALRPIALTTIQRSVFAPDVPTFDESGVPGFDVDQFVGLLAPAATPAPIVRFLAEAMQAMAQDQDGVNRLRGAGFDPVGNTPDEFREIIRHDLDKWRDIITRAGIRIDK